MILLLDIPIKYDFVAPPPTFENYP